jgi:2-amino-4-hydroxy-6-hydroxymethyldihydropteridine diphosphokinase
MRSGIFLLLGTNLGDRLSNLATARHYVTTEAGPIEESSAIFETAAWGKTDQPSFYNQVINISTALNPRQLLTTILSIEHTMGRVREEKWGPRIIDIDILLYQNLLIDEPDLTIPHIGLPDRRFVLEPLNEIAPDLVHPGLHITVNDMLQTCNDPSQVNKLL